MPSETPDLSCGIECVELSVSFTGRRREPLAVLSSLSFCAPAGEFLVFLGPSGCGKTTLLKVIGGLLSNQRLGVQVSGAVHVGGLTPLQARRESFFGFAFQNPVLLPWRSVEQNVGLPLELQGQPSRHEVAKLLDLMGIADFATATPNQLSGGMQQRANIARALVHHPRVLLLDEPFASLDEVTRDRLNVELRRIHTLTQPTILLVTHSLREAAFLADRIFVMSRRPASFVAEIPSPLPNSRTEELQVDTRFVQLVAKIRRALTNGRRSLGD